MTNFHFGFGLLAVDIFNCYTYYFNNCQVIYKFAFQLKTNVDNNGGIPEKLRRFANQQSVDKLKTENQLGVAKVVVIKQKKGAV